MNVKHVTQNYPACDRPEPEPAAVVGHKLQGQCEGPRTTRFPPVQHRARGAAWQ